MNKKQPNPIEGVVHRPKRRSSDGFTRPAPAQPKPAPKTEDPVFVENPAVATQPKQADVESIQAAGIESKISMNLDNMNPNVDDTGDFRSRRRARKLKREQKKSERSKFNIRSRKVAIAAIIIVLAIAGFLAFRGWMALQRIIVDRDGNGSPALNGGELRGEGDGRINIMLLGIGGEGHDGGNLADTIIVASIDPFAKEVAMLSIPRDMYADIPGHYGTKINAAHAFGEDQSEGGGPELMKQTLEQTLDIPIHYFMRVDFTGFVQAIDTVGGVDLFVEEAVYDTHFSGDSGYIVDVDEGWQYFDGTRALYYARSRYTSAGGDFDRNSRQRAIMVAAKEKVFSIGTFGNPNKIRELAESAGDHVRTDMQLDEIRRLYDITKDIPSDKIASYGLSNAEDNYLVSGNIDGASVLMPKAGDYSEIQRFVRELFVDGFIRSEAAPIEMYDGSGVAASVEKADELKSYGYQLGLVADYDSVIPETVIYDRSNGADPYTKRYLEQRFGVTMVSGDQLPSSIESEAAFVIILGSNAQEEG
jgi:LCP family protein required for cell wall assembly